MLWYIVTCSDSQKVWRCSSTLLFAPKEKETESVKTQWYIVTCSEAEGNSLKAWRCSGTSLLAPKQRETAWKHEDAVVHHYLLHRRGKQSHWCDFEERENWNRNSLKVFSSTSASFEGWESVPCWWICLRKEQKILKMQHRTWCEGEGRESVAAAELHHYLMWGKGIGDWVSVPSQPWWL